MMRDRRDGDVMRNRGNRGVTEQIRNRRSNGAMRNRDKRGKHGMAERIRDRRGSTSVESAIYFPLSILCAAAVIALMMNLYMQTSAQVYAHKTVRAASAEASGTTEIRAAGAHEKDALRKEAEQASFDIGAGGLLGLGYKEARNDKATLGRSYIITERLIVKGMDIVR